VCREGVWLSQNLLLGDTTDMDDVIEALHKVRRLASTIAVPQAATERR
jgi:hypothetical protein